MSTKTLILAISWLLWGIGFYLFQPFLSIFLVKFVPTNRLGFFYLITQSISLVFPFIGRFLSRTVGVVKTIILGMGLSGLGIIVLPFSSNFAELFLSFIIYESFYITLPSYYALMRREGENIITRVWAISATPSIVMPSIGGIIVYYFGYTALFIASGIFYVLSGLPLLKYKITYRDDELFTKSDERSAPYVITLIILPVALSSQFIYLVIKDLYNLTVEFIGFIATLAEIFGTILAYFSSYLKPKLALYISMLIFSLQGFSIFIPYFSIFFGSWEAIIPLSLGRQKSVDDFTYAITMQILGWISGYLVATFLGNPELSIIVSCIASILLLPLIKSKY